MTNRNQGSEARDQCRASRWWALLAVLVCALPCRGAGLAALCADRSAIEHVYYAHRLGTKPPFEQSYPTSLLERLVRDDLHKEAVLRKVYGVEVTPAMVEAEVQRINTTTRAPDVLAEIKAALGNDSVRFAGSFARPIVVERTLRARFENDDTFHAPQRAVATQAREQLLTIKDPIKVVALLKQTKNGQTAEVTWQLIPRPADAAPATPAAPSTPTKASAHSGAYSVEATAQLAQVLSSPERAAPGEEKHYFEDFDPELQKVLRVQLAKAGDVSAVIETPGGFLLFFAEERTAAILRVTSLSLPKRSYEAWLAAQPEDKS